MAAVEHRSDRGGWAVRNWFKWKPTSQDLLMRAEEMLFSHMKGQYIGISVPVLNRRIWTIKLPNKATSQNTDVNVPLVMLHGFAGGVGLWTQNLRALAKNRTVYAVDLPGFARSSRRDFDPAESPLETEDLFLESIEEWRKEMNLDKFILLGHSFGGYLASGYSIKYPERVKHLILADPWGFNDAPSEKELQEKYSLRLRTVMRIVQSFNPLAAIRAAGPWGPSLVRKFRSDLQSKFEGMLEDNSQVICDYIYHCNAQQPSGEVAFKHISNRLAWAKHPMIYRVQEIDASVPITMIYGSDSWMDVASATSVKHKRITSYVNIEIIEEAGHHVYADQPEEFNEVVNSLASMVDNDTNFTSNLQRESSL